MKPLIEVRRYLERERKAQANIPPRDRKFYPEVLALDNAYTALRQSLTTELFIEALKNAEMTNDEETFIREYQEQVRIITEYAEEFTVERLIKKHHLSLGYAIRSESSDKDGLECWAVTVRRDNTGAGFDVYAEPGTTVDLLYIMTWLGKHIADKASNNEYVGYARVLVGALGIPELIAFTGGTSK